MKNEREILKCKCTCHACDDDDGLVKCDLIIMALWEIMDLS